MTRLVDVASYLPDKEMPLEAAYRADGSGEAETRLLRRYFGLNSIRLAPDMDLADLLIAAGERLASLGENRSRVRYVIAARTLQGVAPDPAALLRRTCRELALDHAQAFVLTQHACATGLLAVETAGRMLMSDGDPEALALVLTGEKAFTPTVQYIPGTAVMGECTAAVLVGGGPGPGDAVLSYATRTCGEYRDGPDISQEDSARFGNDYTETLAEVMEAAANAAGLAMTGLDLILPHNVNRLSWVRLSRHLGYPIERVFLENVPITGHCFCADSFINQNSAEAAGRLKTGDRYMMVAVGLGATFSAMVLEKG